jgi:hypothetical protein
MVTKFAVLFLGVVLLFACTKSVPSTAPSITFKSIDPATMVVGQGTLRITISYADSDGDLGENNADVKNLFVSDNRNGVLYQFRIPQLSPSGSAISIKGDLNIDMPNVGIADGAATESATFNIYVKDRAGQASNTLTTSAVQLSAQ